MCGSISGLGGSRSKKPYSQTDVTLEEMTTPYYRLLQCEQPCWSVTSFQRRDILACVGWNATWILALWFLRVLSPSASLSEAPFECFAFVGWMAEGRPYVHVSCVVQPLSIARNSIERHVWNLSSIEIYGCRSPPHQRHLSRMTSVTDNNNDHRES